MIRGRYRIAKVIFPNAFRFLNGVYVLPIHTLKDPHRQEDSTDLAGMRFRKKCNTIEAWSERMHMLSKNEVVYENRVCMHKRISMILLTCM